MDKQNILKTLCKSTLISTDEKKVMIEKVLKDDKSDTAERVRLTCEAAFASKENKDRVWAILTEENSKYTVYQREAMMGGFKAGDQELMAPYADKYYEALVTLSQKQVYRYQSSFSNALMPRSVIEDRHLVQLMNIKSQTPDNDKAYMDLLNDVLELLLRSNRVRAQAQFLEVKKKGSKPPPAAYGYIQKAVDTLVVAEEDKKEEEATV